MTAELPDDLSPSECGDSSPPGWPMDAESLDDLSVCLSEIAGQLKYHPLQPEAKSLAAYFDTIAAQAWELCNIANKQTSGGDSFIRDPEPRPSRRPLRSLLESHAKSTPAGQAVEA